MLACMLKGVSALARPASKTGLRKTALRASSPLSTFPLSDSTPTVPCSYAGSASDYEGDLLVIPFWQTADDAVVDVGAATTANAWNDELEGCSSTSPRRDFKGAKGSGCLVSPPDADDAAPDDAYADSLLSETPYEDVEKAGGRAAAIAAGCKLARDLVNAPPNVLTPRALAIAAVDLAKSHAHLDCTCMGRVECERRGMGAFLGVSQGSSDEHEAQFIHLTYRKGVPKTKLCIVGKGLTYDSGGYNLKPSAGGSIELMKFDMGGSAATLGCAAAVAGLGVDDVEVHFIVAACENMISQDAMRPGDVLTASNGKTIEVINTDAEGRLTLADALVYAEALKPDAIVDLATLTGACLEAAASSAMEQVWRMPMPPAYEKDIESTIADLKNVGSGGAITAALFLGHFVEDTPHAHVDIAGPVWNGKAGEATGFGVKTMAQWVEARAAVPADAVF
ncbi:manganese ion binding protein [Aureococcus anophagefferens]|nr:manganese ion binding protein [Aureococcus anophagefferens]